MLCTSEKPLGMIRVDADKVIIACNNTIRSIHEYRSDARRKYCNKWLTAANIMDHGYPKRWKIV